MTLGTLCFTVAILAYLGGALFALVLTGHRNRALVASSATIGSLAVLGLGLRHLTAGARFAFSFGVLPLTGLALRVDPLSAWFLVVIGVVGAASAVYGYGYSSHHEGRYSLRTLGALFNLLLLILAVQVMADNALLFAGQMRVGEDITLPGGQVLGLRGVPLWARRRTENCPASTSGKRSVPTKRPSRSETTNTAATMPRTRPRAPIARRSRRP